ncbi:GNAT family N-acetyltransferase [Psychroserpens sp. MEBiC05023]
MTSNFKIRPVAKSDLEQIFQMEKEAFKPNHYPLFVLRQFYDLSPNLFIVSVNEFNHIIGYCFGGIDHNSNIGWIFALAVTKDQQKKKIGQYLTTKLITRFKNKNITTIQLTTTPDNSPAISLYQKLGFKIEAEVANYYFDNSPRLLMKLEIQ